MAGERGEGSPGPQLLSDGSCSGHELQPVHGAQLLINAELVVESRVPHLSSRVCLKNILDPALLFLPVSPFFCGTQMKVATLSQKNN